MTENQLATKVLDAAFKIHKELGPGLLESAYEKCMVYELRKMNIPVQQQVPIPLIYDNQEMGLGYRADLIVANKLIVELKVSRELTDLDKAQIITYLKLTNHKLGLLINFHVALLKEGVKRVILGNI